MPEPFFALAHYNIQAQFLSLFLPLFGESMTTKFNFREGLYKSPEFEEIGPQHVRAYFLEALSLILVHHLVIVLAIIWYLLSWPRSLENWSSEL